MAITIALVHGNVDIISPFHWVAFQFTGNAVGSPDKHKGGFWGHGKEERERKLSMEEGGADKHVRNIIFRSESRCNLIKI